MPAGAARSRSDFEERTIARLRRCIVPLLLLFYFVAYLDRTNIGFAAITMNTALGISSAQFGLLAGIFFWGYFLFEIPSNLFLHRLGARMWICRILISWGLVAMATGAARTVAQLYAARFLLGLAEAGFFPGIILYLTYWFRQRDQAQVISLFAMALPMASILGSPVSGVILDHVHWAGIENWRWLLILEGLPAVACGILAFRLLPSRPADAAFLTDEEKTWLTSELRREEGERAGDRPISVFRSLVHPHVWLLVAVLFGFDIGLYAMTFYMPQVVKSLSTGSSNTVVGVLVMIPHLAGLVAMVLVSRSSDRRLERRFHTAIPLAVAGVALILLGGAKSQPLSVLLWSFAWMGIYSFLGPFFSIPSRFLAGVSAASGIALINSVGNLGGFFGPSLIGALASQRGIAGALGIAGIALFVPAGLVLLLPSVPGVRRR